MNIQKIYLRKINFFKKVYIIKIMGGLGNQMFQYAMIKSLSIEKNAIFILDLSFMKNYKLHKYGLDNFQIEKNYLSIPQWFIKFLLKLKVILVYDESLYSFKFNPNLISLSNNFIYFGGYFQSELYFKKYAQEILTDFEVKAPLKQKTIELISKICLQNAVSIHIRRGDFLNLNTHNTDKNEYYKLAIDKIEEIVHDPVYYIFSDDMDWVKENFKTNFETIYVDFNTADSNYEDLKLMSSCKHNIIANSSFSWWGAWLNANPSKIVIAPKKWFNGEDYDYSDVIPQSWIKI